MSEITYVREEDSVLRGAGSEYTIRNYVTKQENQRVSVAVSELKGDAPKTMNLVSDRVYYFLEGNATFEFEEQTIQIEMGSVLLIPHKTEYKMQGSFKAVLINAPAFDIVNEKHLD